MLKFPHELLLQIDMKVSEMYMNKCPHQFLVKGSGSYKLKKEQTAIINATEKPLPT